MSYARATVAGVMAAVLVIAVLNPTSTENELQTELLVVGALLLILIVPDLASTYRSLRGRNGRDGPSGHSDHDEP